MGAVYAFSGTRTPSSLSPIKKIGIDLTALFTLAYLNLLETVIGSYEEIVIPHSTLGWLFQERQRALFHQPSRFKDARKLAQLIATNSLGVCHATSNDADLIREVGNGLASLLNASCGTLVAKLRAKGSLTLPEEQHALAYLKLHERPWPNEPEITDG